MDFSSPELVREPRLGGSLHAATSGTADATVPRLRLTLALASQHEFRSTPSSRSAVHASLNEKHREEASVAGQWWVFNFRRGITCITPPKHLWRVRYKSAAASNMAETAPLDIAQATFASVAFELSPHTTEKLIAGNVAIVEEATVANVALALNYAVQVGAPKQTAGTGASWLSAHLLLERQPLDGWADLSGIQSVSNLQLLQGLQYIREHLADDLDLDVLAKETGLSAFKFAALFQRAVGQSPHKFVLSLRMQHAAGLLRTTKKTSAEVALLCGFRTASHFGVAFRKYFGKRPLEIRFAQRRSGLRLNHNVNLPSSASAHG